MHSAGGAAVGVSRGSASRARTTAAASTSASASALARAQPQAQQYVLMTTSFAGDVSNGSASSGDELVPRQQSLSLSAGAAAAAGRAGVTTTTATGTTLSTSFLPSGSSDDGDSVLSASMREAAAPPPPPARSGRAGRAGAADASAGRASTAQQQQQQRSSTSEGAGTPSGSRMLTLAASRYKSMRSDGDSFSDGDNDAASGSGAVGELLAEQSVGVQRSIDGSLVHSGARGAPRAGGTGTPGALRTPAAAATPGGASFAVSTLGDGSSASIGATPGADLSMRTTSWEHSGPNRSRATAASAGRTSTSDLDSADMSRGTVVHMAPAPQVLPARVMQSQPAPQPGDRSVTVLNDESSELSANPQYSRRLKHVAMLVGEAELIAAAPPHMISPLLRRRRGYAARRIQRVWRTRRALTLSSSMSASAVQRTQRTDESGRVEGDDDDDEDDDDEDDVGLSDGDADGEAVPRRRRGVKRGDTASRMERARGLLHPAIAALHAGRFVYEEHALPYRLLRRVTNVRAVTVAEMARLHTSGAADTAAAAMTDTAAFVRRLECLVVERPPGADGASPSPTASPAPSAGNKRVEWTEQELARLARRPETAELHQRLVHAPGSRWWDAFAIAVDTPSAFSLY